MRIIRKIFSLLRKMLMLPKYHHNMLRVFHPTLARMARLFGTKGAIRTLGWYAAGAGMEHSLVSGYGALKILLGLLSFQYLPNL